MFSQILSFPLKDDRITVNQSALNGKNYLHVGGDVAKQIWIPDIIIDKVRETNDLEKKRQIMRKIFQTKDIRNPSLVKGASSIRLYKDSTVVFSSRKNYDLACGMVSFFFVFLGGEDGQSFVSFSLTRLCWSVL